MEGRETIDSDYSWDWEVGSQINIYVFAYLIS